MHLTSARSIWIIRIVWTIIALGIVIALGRALPLNASDPVPIMLDETGPRSGVWIDRPNGYHTSSFTPTFFTAVSPAEGFNAV